MKMQSILVEGKPNTKSESKSYWGYDIRNLSSTNIRYQVSFSFIDKIYRYYVSAVGFHSCLLENTELSSHKKNTLMMK